MKIFLNRSSAKYFGICFLIYTIGLLAALNWNYQSQLQARLRVNLNAISYKVHQFINIAENAKTDPKAKEIFLRKYTRNIYPSNLHIEISDQALPHGIMNIAVKKSSLHRAQVRKMVFRHRYQLRTSYQLSSGKWANIYITALHHRQLINQTRLIFLMLWLAVGVLLYVMTRYLSMSVIDFSQAIRRLGVDLNAPPLSPAGDEQMRACIHDFNEMQQRIRGLVRERTQLLAAISHDLKTPITRLKLRAERFEGMPEYTKFVKDLDEMEAMISSILTYASQTAREEVRRTFDAEALLQTLCDDMADAGKRVTYIGVDRRLVIKGQMNAIKRCFVNLIDNAVKYGQEAIVDMKVVDKTVKISISDKGPGIPEGNFDLAFKPFERLDHSRSANVSGSGLGLAIVKETITAHHGDISLANRVEGGLRVSVTLPLV